MRYVYKRTIRVRIRTRPKVMRRKHIMNPTGTYGFSEIFLIIVTWNFTIKISVSNILGFNSGTIFHRNSNSMENSFFSYQISSKVITMKFGTWHCRCVISCNGVTLKSIFHRIYIARDFFVKWVRGPLGYTGTEKLCAWTDSQNWQQLFTLQGDTYTAQYIWIKASNSTFDICCGMNLRRTVDL